MTEPIDDGDGDDNSNLSVDIGLVNRDYGDLPDTSTTTGDGTGPNNYQTLKIDNGASHVINGVTLGATVDTELDGQPNADASGDGPDEDGVVFLTPLIPNKEAIIQVTVTDADTEASLSAFIDFNGDGNLTQVMYTAIDGGPPTAPSLLGDILLASGVHTITIQVPADAIGTMPARFRLTDERFQGGDSATGPASSGEVEDYVLASLGDYVWIDANENGIQDGTEGGLNDVVVKLLDGNGEPVKDAMGDEITTITANGPTGNPGYYEFPGLPPGDYKVEFVPPTGYSLTTQNQTENNGNDTNDSDANPADGVTDAVTLTAGETDLTVDAGLIGPRDFGDAPDTYGTTGSGGARHLVVPGLFIGGSVDAEADGVPQDDADGDDDAANDDEDGVDALPTYTGGAYSIDVSVTNTTTEPAYLYAYLDFNGNDMFDDDERSVQVVVQRR